MDRHVFIEIIGTNGCGKSTLARSFPELFVGRYDVPTGGMDLVRTRREAKRLIFSHPGPITCYEGGWISDRLHPFIPTAVVLAFDTPLKVCIERRLARRGGRPIDDRVLIARFEKIKRRRVDGIIDWRNPIGSFEGHLASLRRRQEACDDPSSRNLLLIHPSALRQAEGGPRHASADG